MKVSRIRNLRTRPFGWVAKPGWTQWTRTIADWFLLKFDFFFLLFLHEPWLVDGFHTLPSFPFPASPTLPAALAKRNRCRSTAYSSWKTTIKLWVIGLDRRRTKNDNIFQLKNNSWSCRFFSFHFSCRAKHRDTQRLFSLKYLFEEANIV